LIRILRCAAPFALLYRSCRYKYFAALPLAPGSDALVATNVLQLCRCFFAEFNFAKIFFRPCCLIANGYQLFKDVGAAHLNICSNDVDPSGIRCVAPEY